MVFGAWNAVAVAGSNSFAIPAILIGGGSLAVFVADILFSIWRHTKRKPTTRAYWRCGAALKPTRHGAGSTGQRQVLTAAMPAAPAPSPSL